MKERGMRSNTTRCTLGRLSKQARASRSARSCARRTVFGNSEAQGYFSHIACNVELTTLTFPPLARHLTFEINFVSRAGRYGRPTVSDQPGNNGPGASFRQPTLRTLWSHR